MPGVLVLSPVQLSDGTGANLLAIDSSGRVSVLGITNPLPAGDERIGRVKLTDDTNILAIDGAGRLLLPDGAATEVTAAAIQAAIESIKDTDGIKKITDPVELAASSSIIGTVKIEDSGGDELAIDAAGRLILPVDAATQTTLAAVLAELANIATEANTAKEATLSSLLTQVAKESTLSTRASETTLAAIQSAVATETTLAALLAAAATESTLAALLAAAATEATLATRASEATLATRASEATLSTIQTQVAKESTLATRASESNLTGLRSDVAKESTLASLLTAVAKEVTLANLETLITAIKDTDGIKKIVDALPAGDNVVGRVKIDDAGNVLGIEADGAITALKEIQDPVEVFGTFSIETAQLQEPFADLSEITVVHNLGKYPLNIVLLVEDTNPPTFGVGGFGEGGFGIGVGAGGALGELPEGQRLVRHISDDEFFVVLQQKRTGVVLYWV